MFAALSPRDARAAALPARRADQARGPRARAPSTGCRSPTKPDSQDLCFLAGTGRERFLARHGGLRERPGDLVDRPGAVLGAPPRPPPLHGRPAPRARRSRRAEPLYVLRTDAHAQHGHRRPARRRSPPTRVALRGVRLHRAGRPRSTRVRLRYHARRRARAASTATPSCLGEPFSAPRRARRPCCCAGTSWSDVRRSRRVTSDEIRETYLSFFEQRDHKRLPSRVAGPGRVRPVGAAHHRGDAPAQALLPGPARRRRTTG